MALTARQKAFCQEYLKDLNATQAAIRAGYSVNSANEQGTQNLAKLSIQTEINRLQANREARTEITQDKVLKELALCGFTDIKNYLDVNAAGLVKVKNLNDIPPEMTRAIKKIKQRTTIRQEPGGSAKIQDAHLEFELYDKMVALDKIGNHLGMFKTKFEGDIKIDTPEIIRVILKEQSDK